MQQFERGLQAAIVFSRWLLAPFLIGLVLSLFLLMYRFFADFYDLAIRLTVETWHELIVGVLNMIDIVLTANLVLIVASSGYENFIHKIEGRPDLPEGVTAIDFGVLKQRVLGSIAVIASVDALAWYLDIERATDSAKLIWVVAFPLMFAAAMLILALADRISRDTGNTAG